MLSRPTMRSKYVIPFRPRYDDALNCNGAMQMFPQEIPISSTLQHSHRQKPHAESSLLQTKTSPSMINASRSTGRPCARGEHEDQIIRDRILPGRILLLQTSANFSFSLSIYLCFCLCFCLSSSFSLSLLLSRGEKTTENFPRSGSDGFLM